jgi:hypothetical protein
MSTAAKPACPRLFEVEALRDGRLAGAEVARVRAHAGVCPVCAREAEALDALGRSLRSSAHGDRDELHVRRERTRLLAAFDASLVPAFRGVRSKWWWAAVAVLVVMLSAFAVVVVIAHSSVQPDGHAAVAPVAKSPESVVIRAEGDARWSRRIEQHVEKVVLESGSLSIRVDHAKSARRVIVVLPDGELEDIGTTFSVSAAGARTTRVTVAEGSVVLRFNGARPIVLGAGDFWPPREAPAAPSTSGAVPSPRDATTPRGSATTVSAPAASTPVASATMPDPSADFRAASSALNAGNNAGAADLFTNFLANHPRDPRIEDAAYLRVIAFQRSGDTSATERAAADYLRRFPRGFRRTEVEALTSSSR